MMEAELGHSTKWRTCRPDASVVQLDSEMLLHIAANCSPHHSPENDRERGCQSATFDILLDLISRTTPEHIGQRTTDLW